MTDGPADHVEGKRAVVTDDPFLQRTLTPEEAKAYAKVKLYAFLERFALAFVAALQSIIIVALAK